MYKTTSFEILEQVVTIQINRLDEVTGGLLGAVSGSDPKVPNLRDIPLLQPLFQPRGKTEFAPSIRPGVADQLPATTRGVVLGPDGSRTPINVPVIV
jgi:hypothetical protein